MHRFSRFLNLLIVTSVCQFSYTTARLTQVDLVFPRNNTVYQPVYPFPIAFAIHNFSQLWEHHPHVDWSLTHMELGAIAARGVIGWDNEKDPMQNGWGPPPDKYLAINTTTIFSSIDLWQKYNNSAWRLVWEFSVVDPTCFKKSNWSSHYFNGFIEFKTSNKTGIQVLPDIAASGCATELGAVDFLGNQSAHAEYEFCPPLALDPMPVKCAYQANSSTADGVSTAMTWGSGCIKWPNGTYIGHDCEKTKSESSGLRASIWAMMLPAAAIALWSLA